jgi:putative flippase GtrA
MISKERFEAYKDIIYYLIFGGLTTLVNIVVYWLMAHPLGIMTVPSSVIAWIASVTFAYLTNRKWVFHSTADTGAAIAKEAVYFFLCRLSTGVFDWIFMYVTVDLLNWNDLYMKVIANVIVIVLNYVASKLLIFKG